MANWIIISVENEDGKGWIGLLLADLLQDLSGSLITNKEYSVKDFKDIFPKGQHFEVYGLDEITNASKLTPKELLKSDHEMLLTLVVNGAKTVEIIDDFFEDLLGHDFEAFENNKMVKLAKQIAELTSNPGILKKALAVYHEVHKYDQFDDSTERS